jgi:hypothetical protein
MIVWYLLEEMINEEWSNEWGDNLKLVHHMMWETQVRMFIFKIKITIIAIHHNLLNSSVYYT